MAAGFTLMRKNRNRNYTCFDPEQEDLLGAQDMDVLRSWSEKSNVVLNLQHTEVRRAASEHKLCGEDIPALDNIWFLSAEIEEDETRLWKLLCRCLSHSWTGRCTAQH